ncbi:hypothetical protein [Amycolatopsis sp. FDAARGOS 1241]|uniref:hypothetical protein n=1 Tax=Amycolatopsis sp. FDAARGOS 1241 TaxID=2778070 RepID=UPI001950500A|nr:hypothetical protein [Amycolatopsis sp. FDAARGOS 1241]QRP47987.1 hypothetical protein I6J71_08920 [Amycolatopsis sp. FDAARGOS 1241]
MSWIIVVAALGQIASMWVGVGIGRHWPSRAALRRYDALVLSEIDRQLEARARKILDEGSHRG